jgi:hypothetical protein
MQGETEPQESAIRYAPADADILPLKLKRWFLGSPIPSVREKQQRLSKTLGLAVFSSDALSSVAYATEEILLILVEAGSVALSLSWPISLAIVALLFIVATSYYQTIHAYPSGGDAYIVARENLGVNVGLVAAAALMIDYVLTVSVSIAAGVAAMTSAFPTLYAHRVMLCLLCILIITLLNLRGVKESGTIFAVPTYLFIASFFCPHGRWTHKVCGPYHRSALPQSPGTHSRTLGVVPHLAGICLRLYRTYGR